MPHYTYRSEYVRCGKGCGGCPHGPYWYAYYREQGRLKKKYIGKERPEETEPEPAAPPDPREAIFDRETATVQLAARILGIGYPVLEAECRAAWRQAVKTYHPDRGGDTREFQYREAAYSYLKALGGWV